MKIKRKKKKPTSTDIQKIQPESTELIQTENDLIRAALYYGWSIEMTPKETVDMLWNDLGIKYTEAQVKQYISETIEENSQTVLLKSTEGVFSEYVLVQLKIMRDINSLVSEFGKTRIVRVLNKSGQIVEIDKEPNINAIVNALKLKSECADKILKTGQDMGFVTKVPTAHFMLGGDDLRKMKDEQLLKMIANENDQMNILQMELMQGKPKSKTEDVYFLKPKPKAEEAPDELLEKVRKGKADKQAKKIKSLNKKRKGVKRNLVI